MKTLNNCLIATILFSGGVSSAFALRCDGGLVEVGDTIAEVVSKCGPPIAQYSDVFHDSVQLTYKLNNDGMTYQITFINNSLYSIAYYRS